MGSGRISVIIPTMNRPKSLKRTLFKMLQSSHLPDELIVVDQSHEVELQRTNKSIIDEFKKKSENTVCKYIYQSEPSSTRARNAGIDTATGEYLIFSDDDIDVEERTFENLVSLYHDVKVSMIGGLNKSDMPAKRESKLGYLFGTKNYFKRHTGYVTRSVLGRFPDRIEKSVPTEWAMGYFFSVRSDLVERWGIRFDETLRGYAYSEDLDFTYNYYKKSKAEGLVCIYSGDVIVDHLASREFRTPNRKNIVMYVVNREYLSYKHDKCFLGRFFTSLTNYCMVIINMKTGFAKDYLDAIKICNKHRKDLRSGNIPDGVYDL